MKTLSLATLALLSSLGTIGCVGHRHAGASYIIDPACLTRPVVLTDCDLTTEPPHCRGSKVTYIKGCGKIEVTNLRHPRLQ